MQDGKALADDLLFGSSSAKQRLERLPEVMKRNTALAELKAKYEGFGPLIRRFGSYINTNFWGKNIRCAMLMKVF